MNGPAEKRETVVSSPITLNPLSVIVNVTCNPFVSAEITMGLVGAKLPKIFVELPQSD